MAFAVRDDGAVQEVDLGPPTGLDVLEHARLVVVGDFLAGGVMEKLDGIVATNTTVARPEGLRSPNRTERGGLSGRPLRERSPNTDRGLPARGARKMQESPMAGRP